MSEQFDFIIIGGGTAGCVLANRLSEDPCNKVLMLEAGGRDHWWDFRIHMPAAFSLPMGNPGLDWCYETEPEPYLGGRRLAHARGKVLGGSSSINGMIFQRGNPLDYEAWAQDSGMERWSYAHCLPYFKRVETQVDLISSKHFEGLEHALKFRGKTGPLHIERGPCNTVLYNTFFQAVKQAGYQQLGDLNGFRQEGFASFDRTIRQGLRQSAARCYLHPIKARKNLKVICRAQVAGLMLEGKRVTGVWMNKGKSTERMRGQQIVMAAGAFNTPAILQRSGIGPAGILSAADVEIKHELPGVGANLQDHLEVYIQHQCAQPVTNQGLLSRIRQPIVGLQWILTRKGLASTNHFEAGGFIRSSDTVKSPDTMIHFLPLAVRYDGSAPIKGHGFQLHIGPTLSQARGRLWIRNDDYRQPPAFVFNYLSTEQDKQQWLAAIRAARHLLSQPAWEELGHHEISPGGAVSSDSDSQLLNWVKRDAETALHPAGTCKLGVDSQSVVDPNRFTIHGLNGISVVDASLMPKITNGNLSAPVYMMAEKASDALLGNRPLEPEPVEYYQQHPRECVPSKFPDINESSYPKESHDHT